MWSSKNVELNKEEITNTKKGAYIGQIISIRKKTLQYYCEFKIIISRTHTHEAFTGIQIGNVPAVDTQ